MKEFDPRLETDELDYKEPPEEGWWQKLKHWWHHRKMRKYASEHGLDFRVGCVFDHQMRPYGRPDHGDLCEVEMSSGRTAIYRAEIDRFLGDTGQKDWLFYFQGYKPQNQAAPEKS